MENSDFIATLRSDSLGEDTFSQAKHYILKTEDDVIEVVASVAPAVQILEAADSEASLPGKSKILHK